MKALFVAQAIYFLITGLWPLIHIKSFMKVTGPKIDLWLVKTVGVLVTAISIGLFVSCFVEEVSLSAATIALLSALFLACIDVFYSAKGRISRIYLCDAAIELVFVINTIIFLVLPKA